MWVKMRFGYPALPLYWCNPSYALSGENRRQASGISLVTRGPGLRADGEAWDISEFFVLRRYRVRGVGWEMAEKIWRLFPGRWQIRVRSESAGLKFWKSTIVKFTSSPVSAQVVEVKEVVWNFSSIPIRRVLTFEYCCCSESPFSWLLQSDRNSEI